MLPAELSGRILIAGAGVSGLGCARLLHSLGATIVVADDNAAHLAKLPAGVETVDTGVSTQGFDIVVTSPGWRPDAPLLLAAQQAGVPVIGDVELAYRLDRAEVFGPPRSWLVVTGTNGKTTTTGMLASIMEQDSVRSGRRALAVGNIGVSLCDALAATPRVDILVAELSSFQLYWSEQLTPDVGVLLNLADDHLDWHGTFSHYARAKAKVLTGAAAVIGSEDTEIPGYVEHLRQAGTLAPEVVGFTTAAPRAGQVGVQDGCITSRIAAAPESADEQQICSAVGIEPPGRAGLLDATAATAAALLAGAQPDAIAAGLAAYRVAGHRGALVHQAQGVNFIDNSKATNPHAAAAALAGLYRVIWIAGGQLKGAAVDELVTDHAEQLRAAVLLGVDREILAASIGKYAPRVPVTVIADSEPEAAMAAAVQAAWAQAQPGDTVLLAPAAASLDMYPSMAVRGEIFQRCAQQITATRPLGEEGQ